MNELIVRIKRQIRIFDLVLADLCKYQIYSLEEIYRVTYLTIKRGLQKLFSSRIDIHSKRKKRIDITKRIPNKTLKTLILLYIEIE